MENEELRSTIEQIKAQVKAKPENKDKTDDEIDALILDAFFQAFNNGEMEKDDLLGLAEIMGYEPEENFLAELNGQGGAPAPTEGEGAPAQEGEPAPEGQGGEGAPAPTAAEAEETKVIEPGQSPAEFKEKIDEVKEGGTPSSESAPEGQGTPAPEGQSEEDDEDAERKKASELWKMNLNK